LLGDLWHALTRAVQYLAGQWPLLLCLVAAIALARVYLSSGRGQGVRRFWRTFGVMLGRYARLLWGLLFASTENLAARARLLAARGPVRAATAIRRMRGTSLGDMSPRQAVVALYLTALRHAAHRGYARRAGQTPAEYARDLAARVPEAGDPAGKLTETFIVARYGAATVDKARVEQARALWGRVRQALRGRRHRPDSRA
jgi:hypothetical protein